MNERIRELAEQIGFPMGYDNPAWAYEEDIYKFAELIIKECAQIADDCVVLGRDFPGEYIKDYFGVE